MGLTPDEAAIEAAMPKARTVFAELARLLGEQSYFTGDSVLAGRPPGRAAARLLQRDAGMVGARRAQHTTSPHGLHGWRRGRAM